MTKHISPILLTLTHFVLFWFAFQPYVTFMLTLSLLCYITQTKNSFTLCVFDHIKKVSVCYFYIAIALALYVVNKPVDQVNTIQSGTEIKLEHSQL